MLLLIPLLLGLIWVSIDRLLPCLSVRSEDQGRTVHLMIYDGLDDPSAVAAKRILITGQCRRKLDGQIHLALEDKSLVAEYFRLSRSPNFNSPMVTVRYRWQGEDEHQERRLSLSGKIPKHLEGATYGNYMIALGY